MLDYVLLSRMNQLYIFMRLCFHCIIDFATNVSVVEP